MKLYTKTVCPKCLWVKSELQQAGLEAQLINLDTDVEAFDRITSAGYLSVPILECNGELIVEVPKILATIEAMAQ